MTTLISNCDEIITQGTREKMKIRRSIYTPQYNVVSDILLKLLRELSPHLSVPINVFRSIQCKLP